MARTITQAIDQVREIIQDSHDPYRHPTEKLIQYFNDAILDAWRLRTDLFVVTSNRASTWVEPTMYTATDYTDGTLFPLPSQYFTATIDYVAGMIGRGDDEFAVDGRAVVLMNRYSQKLIGKGA